MAALLAACALAATLAEPARSQAGRIGPELRQTPDGRVLAPAGRLIDLGNLATGGAVTPDGRYYWSLSTGRGVNDLRIISMTTGRQVQTTRLPGVSGGIAMDPRGRYAYVSGVAIPGSARAGSGSPGRAGDQVRIFAYSDLTGRARLVRRIYVPAPLSAPRPQNFPLSRPSARIGWPERLAVSSDGSTLLVPLNLADNAAVVDVDSRRVRYVATGGYPYGAVILPGDRYGLVSNETPGTVSVIDLRRARKLGDIAVGEPLSHPTAIVHDPGARRAYVTLTNADAVAVINTRTGAVEATLSTRSSLGAGSVPVDVAVTPDSLRLLVAEAGTDSIAVFGLPGSDAFRARRRGRSAQDAYRLLGRIPAAAYPADVEAPRSPTGPCQRALELLEDLPGYPVRPGLCTRVVWTAAKGFGTGPNPAGPSPYSVDGQGDDQYLPKLVRGLAGVLNLPSESRLLELTRTAARQVVPSNNSFQKPPDTPVREGGPIEHVFFIVRENRTYDQILGDDPRGDGDPSLTLFGEQITPNAHALAGRFPLLDHFFANSESTIDGHSWTSAGAVSHYDQRSWPQSYAARGRPVDTYFAVSWPPEGFLFDAMERQGISYFNYGESLAGTVEMPDRDITPEQQALLRAKAANSDLGPPDGCYPNATFINENIETRNPIFDSTPPPGAPPDSESRFDCFRARFLSQLAAGSVPRFNYLVLPADHTRGLREGERTPQAMIAENDWALGQIVELISNSPIWQRSAIFVVEDDSQNGADSVDAHRIPAFVISPWARASAVISTRYDFLSMIRTMEIILGMQPLRLADALATPMYDAFDTNPVNPAPYTATVPDVDMLERNPDTGPGSRYHVGFEEVDPNPTPQWLLDRLLWYSVHGDGRPPPPPGPNNELGE